VTADLRQVVARDLPDRPAADARRRPEVDVAAARIELLRGLEISAANRVQVLVGVPTRECRREELRCTLATQVAQDADEAGRSIA